MADAASAGRDRSDEEHDRFLAGRNTLTEFRRASIYEFDRQVLVLSAAALGLSIAYMRDYITNDSHTVWLLQTSWGALGLAVLATVISFFTSAKDYRKQLLERDAAYTEGREARTVRGWRLLTSGLTWTALVAFAVGVVCLTAFAVANVGATQPRGGHANQAAAAGLFTRGAVKTPNAAHRAPPRAAIAFADAANNTTGATAPPDTAAKSATKTPSVSDSGIASTSARASREATRR